MWALFPGRSESLRPRVTGFVRAAENSSAIAGLLVSIERWAEAAAPRIVDAATDPGAAIPADAHVSLGSALSKADGSFELDAPGRPAAGYVDVLTVRPPARPGGPMRPLFAQLLRYAGEGSRAIAIDLPVTRLADVGVAFRREGLGAWPETGRLLAAAHQREQSAERPSSSYSRRYTAEHDAADARSPGRISAPGGRGPRLEVRTAVDAEAEPRPRDVARAIGKLAWPEPAGRVVVRQDPDSGDFTVAAPRLPLRLRRPDATPDPFAQRRLEARWASARDEGRRGAEDGAGANADEGPQGNVASSGGRER
ncbi:hypothetical protein PA01_08600 [Azoarcus sp. PA01]|nr:hypothetical protein PA01_08600 [Azoarcus sp. PA01]